MPKRDNGNCRFYATDIGLLTKLAQEQGDDLVLKYATDTRINLYYSDIEALCNLDEENSADIEEVIDFAHKNNLQDSIANRRITEILEAYKNHKDSTKAIMLLGGAKYNNFNALVKAHSIAPVQMETVIAKSNQDNYLTVQSHDFPMIAQNLQKFEK